MTSGDQVDEANPPQGVRVVAIIPARGGSKGLPGKNLKKVGGRTLVERSVRACTQAETIHDVYVTTDAVAIASAAIRAGARIVDRPTDLAGDRASSESALRHAIDQISVDGLAPDVVVFVQCTSPFINPSDLDAAVRRVLDGEADCVFSAVETFEFVWRSQDDGTVRGLNHDHSQRLRRQDRTADWRETGAFYVMTASGFAETGHRFFGRVFAQPVDLLDAVEIDDAVELALARAVEANRRDDVVTVPPVDIIVTDFDGVHTDDGASVDQDGMESVKVHRGDGHGVKLLREAGYKVLILSTEKNPVVMRRAEKLGVDCIHGSDDKRTTLMSWLEERGVDPSRVAYLGNDVNDLGCLDLVGFAVCVADAHPNVLAISDHVLKRSGGHGAVRELAELVLASEAAPSLAGAGPG